jgi:hypothetical protein
MPNALSIDGAQPSRAARFSAMWTERWSSGLWTQRSPLRDAASTRMESKFYGGKNDAFIDGLNTEISNRLTIVRRPGSTVYNSQTFDSILAFYEFRLFDTNSEAIKVMVDTAAALYDGTGPSTKSLVWTKNLGSGQTFMQYVANILYFGNGVDEKKWVQTTKAWQANHNYIVDDMHTFVIDPNGNIQQLVSCHIPVTNITISGNILTVTFNQNVTSILSPGLFLRFTNLVNATFLNNQTDQDIIITSVSGSTIQAPYIHTNYSASDSGTCIMIEGGLPLSGSTTPTWNTTLMGSTVDNTAIWVNRGSTVSNFGIAGPTDVLTTSVQGNTNSWGANTYYSRLTGIIDTNGNFQTVATGGVSASAHPTWSTTLGGTTSDGTVVWTMTRTAALMVWQPSTSYTNGDIIVATTQGGVDCVFQLEPFTEVQLGGTVNAYLWPKSHSVGVGAFNLAYPTSTGSASASATGSSLLFNPPGGPSTNPVQWATLDSGGNITGYTTPFPSYKTDYNMVLLFDLVFPAAGNYTVTITHKDGTIWAMGGGATIVSGPKNDPYSWTQTAVQGYNVFGGTNQSANSAWVDTFVVNIPSPGTYPVEVDYAFWYHSGQTLTFKVNGVNPVPGTAPTTRTSGTVAPTWVDFSTAYAPSYAVAIEASGQLVWGNLGPKDDFSWAAKKNFKTNDTSIVDQNGYKQEPFRTGYTSVSAPTFTTTLNSLSSDNPNLIWINTGKATVTTVGSLVTSNGGWSYCIALVNTLTNTVSNAGPVTVATGSFVGASGVKISGGVPSAAAVDPQVDYVAIFRTKDGGADYYLIQGTDNENTPYTMLLSDYLANGFVDTTPDADLNILLQPALVRQNDPAPDGLINLTYHLNRVFGSVENVVYWSSGPDSPIGNGIEAFSPNNTATFPSLVKRIVPTAIGTLVFTVSDVYLIAGKGTDASPLYPVVYARGVGLLSYNALDINGTTIYLLSTDNQFLALDPNAGVSQIGFPIGDILGDIDPASAYVTWHVAGSQDQAVYVGDGSTGWYRLITTPAPESGLSWCPKATIQGGCRAVQSVEVTPGVNKLLMGPVSSGPILKRDLSVNSDNGSAYTAYVTMGSIVLAQPGQIAELVFITTDSKATGTRPNISVLIDEVSGTFENLTNYVPDPPQLPASTSLYAQRFYFSQTQQPALCRHLQIKVAWDAVDEPNEIYTLTIFGSYAVEL